MQGTSDVGISHMFWSYDSAQNVPNDWRIIYKPKQIGANDVIAMQY